MPHRIGQNTAEDEAADHAPAVQGDMGVFFRQFMALMEASQQGYALFDGSDSLRFANRAFRVALGIGPQDFPSWVELMRAGFRNATGTTIETSDFELWLRSAKTRRGKLPFRTIETSLKDGRWTLTTETTLPGGWMLCVVTDVSELGVELRDLRQERDRALKSALSDELTGLGNRRYAMDTLNHLLGPNKAQALAVIIMDIDHFKSVNDRFGHAYGDMGAARFRGTAVFHRRPGRPSRENRWRRVFAGTQRLTHAQRRNTDAPASTVSGRCRAAARHARFSL